MRPDELRAIVEVLIRNGTEGLIAGFFAFLFLRFFITGYLAEKGKNLATKEDIAAITTEIERVKSQYAVLLEETKAKHQLRMAALDRRLQAHQEAFTLWRELLSTVHTEQVGAVVLKCQEWWGKNCLYLEPSVRDSFMSAYSAANNHRSYVQARTDAALVEKNWKRIIDAGNAILSAVQLPGFTPTELKELEHQGSSQSERGA